MAVSCDSFNEEKNYQIGRHQSGKGNLKCLQNVRDWCRKYQVAFKINTVVNVYNVGEDMNENIRELDPVRWKVSNKYGLLTKCKCKILAKFFFASFWTETESRPINSQRRARPISSYLDRTRLVENIFIIWLSGKFFLRDTAGIPEQAR